MQYLMIENDTVAPIESFTVMGLSTARGVDGKIGQFGTGNKFGILTLLRAGYTPYIFCGNEKLFFATENAVMGSNHAYKKVTLKQGQKAPKDLGWSVDFGALDWTNIHMGLREFVSNAIDQSTWFGTHICISDNPRAKSGTTRIFVELTHDVKAFYDAIPDLFLHAVGKENEQILKKNKPGKTKIYREGVLVRVVNGDGEPDGLFDYNAKACDIQIDEARNMSNSTVMQTVGKILSRDKEAIASILRASIKGDKVWEHKIPYYYYETYGSGKKDNFVEAFKAVCGDTMLTNNRVEADVAARKGFTSTLVEGAMFDVLKECGVKTTESVISEVEKTGDTILDPTPKTVETFNRVWGWITDLNITMGKSKPELKSFESTMNAGTLKMGRYLDNTIFINTQFEENPQTMLEEIAHHITGATDNSRDFQDYVFLVATNAMKLVEEIMK